MLTYCLCSVRRHIRNGNAKFFSSLYVHCVIACCNNRNKLNIGALFQIFFCHNCFIKEYNISITNTLNYLFRESSWISCNLTVFIEFTPTYFSRIFSWMIKYYYFHFSFPLLLFNAFETSFNSISQICDFLWCFYMLFQLFPAHELRRMQALQEACYL